MTIEVKPERDRRPRRNKTSARTKRNRSNCSQRGYDEDEAEGVLARDDFNRSDTDGGFDSPDPLAPLLLIKILFTSDLRFLIPGGCSDGFDSVDPPGMLDDEDRGVLAVVDGVPSFAVPRLLLLLLGLEVE